ncbi:MAG: peptidylprolyl isomerase [Flavobacterium sp.]|nr:peptidylprolyl isomerase [Flavobacterium sp.]
MKFKAICLLFLAMTSGIYAQEASKKAKAPKTTTAKKAFAAKPSNGNGLFVSFETSKGKILVQLEYKKAPVTVANFVALAEGKNEFVSPQYKGKPFYDGLKFHRVIADFMIQGGDPLGTGSGDPGYKFKDEFSDDKFDKAGVLAMANSGPATNGSQFFITHKETSWLNGKHTIFGHVVTGQDVVNAIAQDDVMTKVTIIRKGAEAKAFDAAKIFSAYYATKGEDDKKAAAAAAEKAKIAAEKKKIQDAADAAAKKEYDAKFGSVKTAKIAALNAMKAQGTTTASGLTYKIIKKGDGKKPADGTTVYINYAGYFEDGGMFDSSYESVNKEYGKFDQNRANQNGYQPFPFKYGQKTGLIEGFIEAFDLMSFGDKLLVFIPSKLAYKEPGYGIIPPNTNLIFEIEMLESLPAK